MENQLDGNPGNVVANGWISRDLTTFLPVPHGTESKPCSLRSLVLSIYQRYDGRVLPGPKGARIDFTDKPNIDPAAVMKLMQSAPRRYRLDGPNRIRITADMPDADSRLKALNEFLDGLSTL